MGSVCATLEKVTTWHQLPPDSENFCAQPRKCCHELETCLPFDM